MNATTSASVATSVPDWRKLSVWDEHFNPEVDMIRVKLVGPGYHTTIPDGTIVHPTISSMDYALLQMETGEAPRMECARRIIDKVLPLQVTDSYDPTYGTWPWMPEEPVSQMAPPDMNWADFIGARLAILLRRYEEALGAELVERIRVSLRHAAHSMFRRNVQPGYSNIAVMGGWATAAAGELLNEPWLLEYGRTRVERAVEFINENGSFTEYNSPTYTLVAMVEAERAIQCVRDERVREAAEALRREAWRMVVEHFHYPTLQWAGPHCRAYDDRLTYMTAYALDARLDFPLPVHPGVAPPMNLVIRLDVGCDPMPCPEDLRQRLRVEPVSNLFRKQSFGCMDPSQPFVTGSTWFDGDACLGSANEAPTWYQCRPLIGYWRTEEDSAIVFRARILANGRDFAAGLLFCEQDHNTVQVRIGFAPGTGYFHPHFGKPEDGIFELTDLRVRLELRGKHVAVEQLAEESWSLRAAPWQMTIQTPSATFDDQPVRWQSHNEDGLVCVDAVLGMSGEPWKFDPTKAHGDLPFSVSLTKE